MAEEITQKLGKEQAERLEGRQILFPYGKVAHIKYHYALEVLPARTLADTTRLLHLGGCRKGFCPPDRRWGLSPANTTSTVQSEVTELASQLSYTRVPTAL